GGTAVEGLVQLGVEGPELFLVERIAAALAQGGAGRRGQAGGAHGDPGGAVLQGALAGFAVLMAELPVQAVGERAVQLEALFQAEAFALGAVVGGEALDQAVAAHRSAGGDAAEFAFFAAQAGIGAVLVALVGELQAAALGVVPAELCQQVVGAVVQRVGLLASGAAAGVAAMGVERLAIAATEVQQ